MRLLYWFEVDRLSGIPSGIHTPVLPLPLLLLSSSPLLISSSSSSLFCEKKKLHPLLDEDDDGMEDKELLKALNYKGYFQWDDDDNGGGDALVRPIYYINIGSLNLDRLLQPATHDATCRGAQRILVLTLLELQRRVLFNQNSTQKQLRRQNNKCKAYGCILVCDLSNFGWHMVRSESLLLMQSMIHNYIYWFPDCTITVLLTNAPSIMPFLWTPIIEPLLPTILRKRIHFVTKTSAKEYIRTNAHLF